MEVGSNRACFLLHTRFFRFFFGNASCLLTLPAYLGSLSFFNSHSFFRILRIESLFCFFRLKSFFRSTPFRKRPPARLCGRSWACVLGSFPFFKFLRFDLNAMAEFFRVGSGIRSGASSELILRSEY